MGYYGYDPIVALAVCVGCCCFCCCSSQCVLAAVGFLSGILDVCMLCMGVSPRGRYHHVEKVVWYKISIVRFIV